MKLALWIVGTLLLFGAGFLSAFADEGRKPFALVAVLMAGLGGVMVAHGLGV